MTIQRPPGSVSFSMPIDTRLCNTVTRKLARGGYWAIKATLKPAEKRSLRGS